MSSIGSGNAPLNSPILPVSDPKVEEQLPVADGSAEQSTTSLPAETTIPEKTSAELVLQREASLAKTNAELGYRFNPPFAHIRPLVTEGVDSALKLGDNILGGVGIVATGTKVALNQDAVTGTGLAFTAAGELNAGIDYFFLKRELSSLEKQRAALQKKDSNSEIKTQLDQLNKKIEKLEAAAQAQGKALLSEHLINTVSGISGVLSFSTRTADLIAATSGGLVLGLVGLVASVAGVFSGVKSVQKTNDTIAKLDALQVDGEKDSVSAALDAVKNAALDQAANHQKTEIGLGIFQSAFSACSSALGIAGGAIGIAALAGVTLSASAVAFTGIGLPIVAGVGLLIAGGIAIYTHRHTIARGVKGLFAPREADQPGRFSLQRNLRYRQWRVKGELADVQQKIDKLESKTKSLDPGSEKFAPIDHKIRENIERRDQLAQKVDEIKLKRAAQILRDQSTASPAQSPESQDQSRTSADVLNAAIDALPEAQIDKFAHSCKERFPGMKLDKLDGKSDKKSYLKIQIQKAITGQTFFE